MNKSDLFFQGTSEALEKALKAQREATAAVESIRDMIDNQVEEYEVVTPVDEYGKVLFDDLTQRLCVNNNGKLYIDAFNHGFTDYRSRFVWVPCEREDLVAGDVAYATDNNNKDFSGRYLVKTMVSDNEYWRVDNMQREIRKGDSGWLYWYKLTPKSK